MLQFWLNTKLHRRTFGSARRSPTGFDALPEKVDSCPSSLTPPLRTCSSARPAPRTPSPTSRSPRSRCRRSTTWSSSARPPSTSPRCASPWSAPPRPASASCSTWPRATSRRRPPPRSSRSSPRTTSSTRNSRTSSRTSRRPRTSSSPSARPVRVPPPLNAALQAAYFIIGVRAAGLAAGPMTGFDFAGVQKEFLDDDHTPLMVVNIGKPGRGRLVPALPAPRGRPGHHDGLSLAARMTTAPGIECRGPSSCVRGLTPSSGPRPSSSAARRTPYRSRPSWSPSPGGRGRRTSRPRTAPRSARRCAASCSSPRHPGSRRR